MHKLLAGLLIASLLLPACKTVQPAPITTPNAALIIAPPAANTAEPTATIRFTATQPPVLLPPTQQATQTPLPTPDIQPTPDNLAIDCKGARPGDKLKLVYEWSGAEEEKLRSVLNPLEAACGIIIAGQSASDPGRLGWKISALKPDILFTSQKLAFTLYKSSFLDLAQLGGNAANYSRQWIDFGSINGKWLAMPISVENRSLIWFSPARFRALGYQVPVTLPELVALVDKMVLDGNVPWSMGFENGKYSGAVGADFIEDILLAQKGQQYIQDIISFKLLYNDPGIYQAFELYKQWAADPAYTAGGAQGTLTINYKDAIAAVFSPHPAALMVRQSEITAGEIRRQFPELKYGVDFDFFRFPGLKDLQVGAQYLLALQDTPAVRAITAYLSNPGGVKAWIQANLAVSPNQLAPHFISDPLMARETAALNEAESYVPSFGDAMPVIDDPPGRPFAAAQNEALVLLMESARIKAILDNVTEDELDASLWDSAGSSP